MFLQSIGDQPRLWALALCEISFWVVRVHYARKAKQAQKDSVYKGGILEVIFLPVFFILYSLFPAVPYFPRQGPVWGDYTPCFPGWVMAVAGLTIHAIGVWAFFRAHADLGKYWSVTLEIQDGHSLVTSGVYSIVRHPMYSSGYVMAIAKAFLVPNAVFGLAPICAMTLVTRIRLRNEEKMLMEQFGKEYAAYSNAVGALLPKFPLQVRSQQFGRGHKAHARNPVHDRTRNVQR